MPIASPHFSTKIVLFRRDLRLADNRALQAAADSGGPVICVYLRAPGDSLAGALGPAQAWWLHHSLIALGNDLRARGNNLTLLTGDSLDEVRKLVFHHDADSVYWNRRHDPDGMAEDTALKAALKELGVTARSFSGQLLHDPTRLRTQSGAPYKVYTPFWRALEANGEPHMPFDAPDSLMAPDQAPATEDLDSWNLLPAKPDWAARFGELWTPGENGAIEKLNHFIHGALDGYKLGRDVPGRRTTSMLSPHLAMGEIAPHRIWHATRNLPETIETDDFVHFRKELVWRDFSWNLLFHHRDLPAANLNRRFDAFPWSPDSRLLDCWKKGLTGYPIVDAGMRQLWQFGWMHNRVRMVAASFLIKDLLIDWREGERWFRHTLVDADPASNAASWQWVAGSGADASPFFRIFNPLLQGEKFDPRGDYIRQFVPEIARLPDKFIHRPFEASPSVLENAGVVLGETYPQPVISHAWARNRALAAFKALKEAS